MGEIIFTYHGDPVEFRAALRSVLGEDGTGGAEPGPAGAGRAVEGEPLSIDECETLLAEVTDDARRVVREIARLRDGCSFEQVIEATGLRGLLIGGSLSSIGHQRNRLFPGRPAPLTRDYRTRVYHIADELIVAAERTEGEGISG